MNVHEFGYGYIRYRLQPLFNRPTSTKFEVEPSLPMAAYLDLDIESVSSRYPEKFHFDITLVLLIELPKVLYTLKILN